MSWDLANESFSFLLQNGAVDWYDIWYDIWYDMWCDVIYDMIRYDDMIWYDICYNMIRYYTIWYDMIWYVCMNQEIEIKHLDSIDFTKLWDYETGEISAKKWTINYITKCL